MRKRGDEPTLRRRRPAAACDRAACGPPRIKKPKSLGVGEAGATKIGPWPSRKSVHRAAEEPAGLMGTPVKLMLDGKPGLDLAARLPNQGRAGSQGVRA